MTKKMKYFIPVMLIALILTGASCGEDDDKKSDKKKEKVDVYASYDTYEKESWGFDIKYPEDWEREILTNTTEEFVVGFLSPKEGKDDLFTQNLIVYASLAQPQDFDELMQIGIEEMSKNPSVDLDSSKKVMISGSPAYEVKYSVADVTVTFKYLHYFINGGKFWYQVLYTADEEGYATFVAEAQKMIDSFIIK